jgi:phenylacetate-CoA ligase
MKGGDMDGHSTYFDHLDLAGIRRDHPIGDDFLAFARRSKDEIRTHQEKLFQRVLARAWRARFYQRLWGDAGIEPGDITGLDDLAKLPTFEKADIVRSVALAAPFGDFAGLDSYPPGDRPPVIFHTTSGTTGRPQPLLFGPKTREVQNLILGRIYRFQGLRPDDVAHSVYGHGMINGGHFIREAVTRWTSSILLSAGAGVETRSAQQVRLMADFGVTVLLGFADYLKRLADVAREEGLVPGEDIRIRMISGQFGREDKGAVSALWCGAECFDWYGVGDTGAIAAEGPDRAGLYVMEDAHCVELLDVDAGTPVAPGETGDLVVTCLYKDDVYPIIRFNTHDVTREETGVSALGWNLRRIAGFLGRSDNMLKLRGINVFPQAIGAVLAQDPVFAGEYVCRAVRDGAGRDDLIVLAESADLGAPCAARMVARLKQALGVEMQVQLVRPGETASLTQLEQRQKPIRLIDERDR